jgi:hypothetical protein
MASPPTSPSQNLQGASRITGGSTRGKATGNVFNLADAVNEFEMTLPRTGKVHLYTSLVNPAEVKPPRVVKIDVKFSMAPILKAIAAKWAPIESNCNYHLMIF